MIVKTVQQSIDRIGLWGTSKLLLAKLAKQQRYKVMLREVAGNTTIAQLELITRAKISIAEFKGDEQAILDAAERMLKDQNVFFTFPYSLTSIESPWQYDPLEKKYWPKRHYDEQTLHAADTPKDVKIVWEINRFKDLPALAQAACLTQDVRFADAVRDRLHSWITDNPFAATINWASPLEISIRLIAWSSAILLLREAGFSLESDPVIARSIYQHARYLAADLSNDKVVTTNHLIGEVAGLFIASTLWNFPVRDQYAEVTLRILEREIIRQTFADGVTREASSWYHSFVTDFFDLVDRLAEAKKAPMSAKFKTRLAKMKGYVNAMTYQNQLVRYGDGDDGVALYLSGDSEKWKTAIFGPSATQPSNCSGEFTIARHVATHVGDGFVFIRAGEFGMGGNGFSSHAHDDLLSPIVYLAGEPIFVDPGTFVYNGDKENRSKYRGAPYHNSIVIGGKTGAVQRLNFGWERVREEAWLNKVSVENDSMFVVAKYGEWSEVEREILQTPESIQVTDRFSVPIQEASQWRWHLHAQWTLVGQSSNSYHFKTEQGKELHIVLQGVFDAIAVESYDYSPSYRVATPGTRLVLTCQKPVGEYSITLRIL